MASSNKQLSRLCFITNCISALLARRHPLVHSGTSVVLQVLHTKITVSYCHPPFHGTTPQPFYGPFSGTTRVSRCQKRTLNFKVQGKINRGRHKDDPAGCHSIWTNQCPPPPSLIFYRLDAIPAIKPTVSKH